MTAEFDHCCFYDNDDIVYDDVNNELEDSSGTVITSATTLSCNDNDPGLVNPFGLSYDFDIESGPHRSHRSRIGFG